LIVLFALAACGTDDPGREKPYQFPSSDDGGSSQWDGFSWTDTMSTWRFDTGFTPAADQGTPKDQGTQQGDGSSQSQSCKKPAAQCSPCAKGEICTDVSGGSCVKVVVLKGKSSDKAVLKAVAEAYVDCWHRQPESDTMCVAFDTCEMTGALSANMVESWVCSAQVTDFSSTTNHDKAKDLCGCSWYGYDRADWKTDVNEGEEGNICLSYDVNAWLYFDHLHVNTCKSFPPS
jgi:hypothetical protein